MSARPSAAMQANVLTLNRAYVAIQVTSVRRAFCLLWKNQAEVVSVEDGMYLSYDFESWLETSEFRAALDEHGEHEDWIWAVNFQIQVPRVIRLLRYDRFPANAVKFNRRNIFLRDTNRCQYCNRRLSAHQLSLDHVIPRSRGGKTCWENVVSACVRCNVRKGGRTPQEAGMRLQHKPVKPKRNPIVCHQLKHQKYESWKNFLDEAFWAIEIPD